MRICVMDGIACCAKWVIRAEFPSDIPTVDNEIYCYVEKEKDHLISFLKEKKIEYVINEIADPPGFNLTRGIKYNSRSEALAHIEKHILPESQTVPLMQKKLTEQEGWIAAALTVAQEAREKAVAIEAREAAKRDEFEPVKPK